MPKNQASNTTKINKFIFEFPNEFQRSPSSQLYCLICSIQISYDRRSTVIKHRESSKHLKGLNNIAIAKSSQSLISETWNNENLFQNKIVKAFLSADIPLYKVNNAEMKSLFTFMGRSLPSESAFRSQVPIIAAAEISKMKDIIIGKNIFLIVDESDISGRRFFNTLIGSIDNPNQTYLLDCRVCNVNMDNKYVVHMVDDLLKEFSIDRHHFSLLISDAASYMIAAGNILKVMYPQLLHVTCISHLFHNCCEKVRSRFTNVDNVIARVKASITRNRQGKNQFYSIGIPPDTIITRWASWLKSALYYAEHLPAVKNIVNQFTGNGLLVTRAKEALSDVDLPKSLHAIKRDYEQLIYLVEKSEKQSYNMLNAYSDLTTITFGEDCCNIGVYLKNRLQKNCDLTTIATLDRNDISPSDYLLLQKCQATSASVERSFSMLKKILAKDRPFKEENIKNYLITHINTVQSVNKNF